MQIILLSFPNINKLYVQDSTHKNATPKFKKVLSSMGLSQIFPFVKNNILITHAFQNLCIELCVYMHIEENLVSCQCNCTEQLLSFAQNFSICIEELMYVY
uniref:Uncharacterized protein n=1 Tax=Micrurus lemniscatus lemniscatus TaxID=129467 RepID=A0A2D4IDK8_MICLE